MQKWIIPPEAEGIQIEEWVADALEISDVKVLRALLKRGVRCNGAGAKGRKKLLPDDVLELYTEGTPYNRHTQVEYEDDKFIIFNKEQDVSCYTNTGDDSVLLYDLAEQHMKDTGEFSAEGLRAPYICHGVDKRTGGLVMVAKDEIAYQFITQALAQRRIKKRYRCIVLGEPASYLADLHDYMVVPPNKFSKVQVFSKPHHGTQPILLRYELVRTTGEFSLLDVEMVTDNIFQICAQLALHGLPVLGDSRYGNVAKNSRMAVKYPALWAYRLDFEVGPNPLDYLDYSFLEASYVGLPYIQGLKEPLAP